mgnify:CR=1 FL=1
MKHLKIALETIITALGLALVLITLSGTTRTWALWFSAFTVICFVASQYTKGSDDD